jgi:hypothetical protein
MGRWVVLVVFLIGLGLGVAGTLWGPSAAAPYLPDSILGKTTVVDGAVLRKQREGDRLLVTVSTPQGAVLATFTRNAAAVDLLVAEGDTLTLALRGYQAFVDDPTIRRVRKPESPGAAPGGPPASAPTPPSPAR